MITIYSALGTRICKIVLCVLKLVSICMQIEAHTCESLDVTHKSLHTSSFLLMDHTVDICSTFEPNFSPFQTKVSLITETCSGTSLKHFLLLDNCLCVSVCCCTALGDIWMFSLRYLLRILLTTNMHCFWKTGSWTVKSMDHQTLTAVTRLWSYLTNQTFSY